MLLPPAARFAIVALSVYVVLPLYIGLALCGVPGLLTVAAGLLTAVYLYGDSPRRYMEGIPGPEKTRKFLTGNIAEFIQFGYHEYYGQITKEYGDVASVQLGAWPQIVVSDPAIIKQICLENFDSFRDRKGLFALRKSKGLLFAKGDHWQASRRALNPAFNSIKLSAFAEIISRHCDALVKRLDRVIDNSSNSNDGGGPIDVLRLFGDLTMDVIGSTSFDSEFGQQETDPPSLEQSTSESNKKTTVAEKVDDATRGQRKDLLEAAKTIFMNLSGPMGSGGSTQKFVSLVMPFLGPLFKLVYPILRTPESRELSKAIKTLDTTMSEILQGRGTFATSPKGSGSSSSSTPPPVANFIDLVRKARDPDSGLRLEDDEVRDQLNLFVLAGYETTANTLAYVAFLLSQNPEAEARLVDEINRLAPDKAKKLDFKDLSKFEYTSNVVSEALRLYPPGAMISRVALRDVTLGSSTKKYLIKNGTWVIVPIYSLHRDERFWEQPEAFDPDRFLPERSATRSKYVHLPFGLGPRNCIGQRFALEEIKLALITLYREHTFKLHEHTLVPLKLRAGITLSPVGGIWMTVHRRGESERA